MQLSTAHLDFFLPTLIHPFSPALTADAQSPVCGVAAAWGGTCLFHGPNDHRRASVSPLTHIHHVSVQPPPQLPAPGTFPRSGGLEHTAFRKDKYQEKSLAAPTVWDSARTRDYSGNSCVHSRSGQAGVSAPCNSQDPPYLGS